MSQNIDCLRQVFAGQAHTLTFPGLLLEPNMISRPANNRYWGQSLHSVSITKSLVFMRARRAREHLYLRSVSCNCTPRCAKWAVTRQEDPGVLTWLWLFLSPLFSLLWATCFLFLLGDFGDWIKIYIFSQNFWKMIRVKSYSLFLTTKEMSFDESLQYINFAAWQKLATPNDERYPNYSLLCFDSSNQQNRLLSNNMCSGKKINRSPHCDVMKHPFERNYLNIDLWT